MELVLIALMTFLFFILNKNISMLQHDQKQIESKLNRIIDYLGVPEPSMENIGDELKEELIKLVERNEKVKAIKKLKDATGMGLEEAKDYVDSLCKNI